MGWGVLQDSRYPNVRTVNLNEEVHSSKLEDWEYEEPKKREDIVLPPQPTDSPNDPLNWSTGTKMAILFIVSLTADVTVSLGPMMTTGFDEIEKTFNVTADQISFSLVGLLQITTGSRKRPVFLIPILFLFGTSAWGFFAGGFLSLTLMRVVQGFSAAPLETLISATISEIFFVHEKGKMLSIWNLFVMGGVKLGQLIAGFIIQNLVLNLPSAFELSSTPLSCLLCRISKAGFWCTAWKPVPLITFPVVIYVAFTYFFYAAGLTLIALLQGTIFSAAPYNLSSSAIGLTNLPLFGVGLIGTLLSGYTADYLVQFLTRLNNGVYEPELRLLLMLVAGSLSSVAYIGFGYSIAAGTSIYIPIAFLGVQTFSVPFATSAMFTYVMDCHPSHAAQAFVTMNFVKTAVSLAMSEFVNGWFEFSGVKLVFMIVVITNLARLRSKIARSAFHLKF
ncbi:major facilitator superfamily domain-containing protein [Hyaloscypha sp. PMI_1271]|nr:major facilitator superfamily domain-containing protein [Hyaloscypha sp. PMI_1271]